MKLDVRPTAMERLVRTITLAVVAAIGLQILWSLVLPWLPTIAAVVTIGSLLRLWWHRTRW